MTKLISNIFLTVGLYFVFWAFLNGALVFKGLSVVEESRFRGFVLMVYSLVYVGLALRFIW